MRENSFIKGLADIADMAGKEFSGISAAVGQAFGFNTSAAPAGAAGQPAQGGQAPAPALGDFRPARVVYDNAGATRNLSLQPDLEQNIGMAVGAVYGPGYTARIYSGGQAGKDGEGPKSKGRVGSVRHDHGRAADVRIYDPEGNQVTGDGLAPLGQFWAANKIGGIGMEMDGGGIHIDNWANPPEGGGMAWSYGEWTPNQAEALAMGAKGQLPELAQTWASELIARSDDPNRPVNLDSIYTVMNEALTPVSFSAKNSPEGTSDPVVLGPSGAAYDSRVEEALGGMLNDLYGQDNYDEQMKNDGQASVMEVLSVGLGQMSRGDRVDVTGVLRAQEERINQLSAKRLARYRAKTGAEIVLQQGGSMEMAQAVASGALSYSDVLNERQIANAEAQLMRENQREDRAAAAMQSALTELGYSPEEVALGMNDPTSFFKIADMQAANEKAEQERIREENLTDFRREWARGQLGSDDPLNKAAGEIMLNSVFKLSPEEALAAATDQAKARQGLAEGEQKQQAATAAATATRDFRTRYEEMVKAGQIPSDVDQAVYAELMRDSSSTIDTAYDRAIKSMNATKDRAQGTSADERAFYEAEARATAQGPEALAAFEQQYPLGPLSWFQEKARSEGGIATPPSTPTTADVLPLPNGVEPNSLLGVASQLTGVRGSLQKLAQSTAGQFFPDLVDPAFVAADQAYNTWYSGALQSMNQSGRMLAQELEFLRREVAPTPGILVGSKEFRTKLLQADQEFRRSLAEKQARYNELVASGQGTSSQAGELNMAITALEGVIRGLSGERDWSAVTGAQAPEAEATNGGIALDPQAPQGSMNNPIQLGSEEDAEGLPEGTYIIIGDTIYKVGG